MRILITGGAGFIGSHLADRLLQDAHDVVGVDNFLTGNAANWPDAAELHEFDICDRNELYALANELEPELVIHCAASYSDPNLWHRDMETNVGGSINAALVAKHHNARIVYFQTTLCYGTNPYKDPFNWPPGMVTYPGTPLPIYTELRPESSYAISKTAGEQYIANSGVPFLSFRLANMYGPRNLSGPVPTFYKRLTRGESCSVADTRRDFVYIADLVDLVMAGIASDKTGCYHASSGVDRSIASLYEAMVDTLGCGAEAEIVSRQRDDAATILLDPFKTKLDFDWSASTPFSYGIEQAVAWYREHGVGETYTHLKMTS